MAHSVDTPSMRALHWNGQSLRTVICPRPAMLPGTALIRVHLAGICNTDLEITKGYMGFRGILGHELVGTVAEGPPEWLGARVVAEINFACEGCDTCRAGLPRHCPERRVMGILGADGALAEYVSAPIANLHRVPDGLADDDAVFTEPLAAAFEILDQVPIRAGMAAVVLGDGKLGLLAAQVLHSIGARVTLIGKHASKLAIARRCGIAAAHLDAGIPRGADVVVEATGSPAGLRDALATARPRGTVVLKSTVAHPEALDLSPAVINEITIVGSRCGRFAPALAALAQRTVHVDPLIAARVPLAEARRAFDIAAAPGTLKVLVDCA